MLATQGIRGIAHQIINLIQNWLKLRNPGLIKKKKEVDLIRQEKRIAVKRHKLQDFIHMFV